MNSEIEWPFVSVILVVRDGERFLAEAIRSVQAQNYPSHELIVVDGHSTDGTAEIARSFSGVKILTQLGRGVPEALNCGIAAARGDWIAFIEHDDIWTPEKLRAQISFMLARPELQFTQTRARFFLEPGCAWPSGYNPDWLNEPQIGAIMSTFVGRKSVFQQVGKFDEQLKCAGDVDWFARAKDLGVPMAYLEETLLLKRVHDSNVTSQAQLNSFELLQVIKRKLDRNGRRNLPDPETAPDFEVSVIIPAFNAERYVAAAIESVLEQTIRPAEIIVVDDGSTDHTAKIAEQFGLPMICHRRPHSGIAATRNFGICTARGNWLAFLDSDDLWTREKLERQLAAAKKDSALEMIFGGVRQFVSPELGGEDQLRLAAPHEPSTAPHAGAMLAQRAVFERIGLFDETLKIAEFIEWFARARDAGVRAAILPEIVLQRRRHLGNTTLREKNSLADMTLAMKRILDRRRRSVPSLLP
jgi:glycosyltransferase involved in cell wall biosynthesis